METFLPWGSRFALGVRAEVHHAGAWCLWRKVHSTTDLEVPVGMSMPRNNCGAVIPKLVLP